MPRRLVRSLFVLVPLSLALAACDPDAQLPLPGSDADDPSSDTAIGGADVAQSDTSATPDSTLPIESDSTDGLSAVDTSGPDVADAGAADTGSPADTGPESPAPGSLCASCDGHESCGGQDDLCLENNQTGEVFCGQHCQAAGDCPGGYACVNVGGLGQCVPESETCGHAPEPEPACDPTCPSGEVCVDGACMEGGMYEAELQHCVDVINAHRAAAGRGALQRDAEIEACATTAALADAQSGVPHGHFNETGGCGGIARAENEIPGWSLANYGSVENVVEIGAQMMIDEGPGGGHHDNILNGGWTRVGCGIHVTAGGGVWVIHNFR